MWRTTVLLLALTGTALADDDDGTTKGAVPIPGEVVLPEVAIDHRDTTVTLDELPKLGAKWKKRARVLYKGVVPIAVSHASFHINLSFVGPVNPESGYPGTLKRFPLVSSDDGGPWSSSFPAAFTTTAKRGPIQVAIRVLPSTNGEYVPVRDESQRRQVVVYVPPKSRVVLVATKLVTESTWTPLLRVDTPNVTRIDVIDPGWH
jgi:hypothetical protein